MKPQSALSLLALCTLLIHSVALMAQNGNVFPQSGLVGIGTTSPAHQLHVVGNSMLDGNATLTGSMDVFGDLRVFGISASGSPTRLLGVAPDGRLVPVGMETMHIHYLVVDSAIQIGDSSFHTAYIGGTSPANHLYSTYGTMVLNGYPNTVTENTCINPSGGQVGVGYPPGAMPAGVKFSVLGNSFISGYSAIGGAVSPDTRLSISANTNETGLRVDHTQTSPFGFAIRDVVHNTQTKAFVVSYDDNNTATADPETFTILGRGITNISGLGGVFQTNAQLYVSSDLNIGCHVKTTANSAGKVGYLADVRRLDTRAISVIYNDNNPNTVDPENFSVDGAGITKIGAVGAPNNAQVTVTSGADVGCLVKSTNTTPSSNKVAFLAEVPFFENKAISVVTTAPNYPGPREVFRVTGGGVAWMQEIRVRVAPFPDYVFDDDYKLMDLDSLDAYISENHKLPGMPSAAEVAENDANLGELVRLQQEKIEELTLYILQLRNEIDKLEIDNDK